MTNTTMKEQMVITMFYFATDASGEWCKIVKQALNVEGKLQKYLAEAKEKTFEFIDKGLYMARYEVYLHPPKTQKPFLEKYKQTF